MKTRIITASLAALILSAWSGAAIAQSAQCTALNGIGARTLAPSNSESALFAPGDILSARIVYSPDSGTRSARVAINELGNPAVNYDFASSGVQRQAVVNSVIHFFQSNRLTTDPGTTVTLFLTCQAGAPVISGLSSTSGPPAGGGALTITGGDLGAATSVAFGATPATSFTVNSNSSITVVIPPGVGAQNVTVTDSTGTSATSAATVYTYAVPATIPTLSEWAMILLTAVLAACGAGLLTWRRRRQA